ncbi:MAG: alpha-hydroxy acid oxidase [Myxococcales bacterium]|nr:alpha-hydroxy acid oxidase [Myxococcales bacterium]
MDALNLIELEAQAKNRLAEMAWDYYRSGADDELTLRRNRAAFAEVALRYRVLVDVARRELSTRVLGCELELPIMLAPTAFHRLAHPEGELATVRAATAAGTSMILSSLSTTPVEEVVAASGRDVWFQLYVYKDRAATRALVERVREAGCKALVLTVDAPLLGRRERDVRNRFALPKGMGVQNMLAEGYAEVSAQDGESGLAAYFARLLDPSLTWSDLEWLRATAQMPVLVKGVVRADDARRAVEHGADGIVVSNHGGRQLDGSVATIEALPAIADEVGAELPLLCDGGIRRGTDVLKALALGASAVLVGRPQLWGLAAGGEAGVRHALQILHEELDRAMALAGCPDLGAVTRDLIA